MSTAAVRDGYAAYQHRSEAGHAWCGAHLIRDLRGVHETDPAAQHWAEVIPGTLLTAKRLTEQAVAAGRTALTTDEASHIRACHAGAVTYGREQNPPDREGKPPRAGTLVEHFATHRDMILRCTVDLAVPFTNNQAQRDPRPVKLQQKISATWRTLQGLTDFATLRSYPSTTRHTRHARPRPAQATVHHRAMVASNRRLKLNTYGPGPSGAGVGLGGAIHPLGLPVELAWVLMESPGLPKPLRARIAEQGARPTTDELRHLLHVYVADCDGVEEVRAEMRRAARVDAASLRQDLVTVEAVLAQEHTPGTLLRLVEGDGNWGLDDNPTDAGAATFLRELARMLRSVLDGTG
jgi:hypothetical protein